MADPPPNPEHRVDRRLWRAFRETGDAARFAELVRRHRDMVFRTCLRILRDPSEAEEAAQATFVLLWQRASSMTFDLPVAFWLYRTAEFTARAYGQRLAATRRKEAEVAAMNTARQAASDRRELEGIPDVDRALKTLSHRLREAVVLRYLCGLSENEVSQELGCSEVAARVRIFRGLEKLRGILAKQGAAVSIAALAAGLAAEQAGSAPATLSADGILAMCTGQAAAPPAVLSVARGVERAMAWSKVKLAAVIAACAAAGAAGGVLLVRNASRSAPAESRAAGSDPAAIVPRGAFAAGMLEWTPEGLGPLRLHLQFRDGRVTGYHAYFPSAGSGKPRPAGPVTLEKIDATWDCSGLAFDGARLAGRARWMQGTAGAEDAGAVRPAAAVEIDAAVTDGLLSGTANGRPLAGWLRGEESLGRVRAVAPDRDWPQWSGPSGNWSAAGGGRELVDDLNRATLAWFGEDLFPGTLSGRGVPAEAGRSPDWRQGGQSSPLVGGGRVYLNTYVGSGDAVGRSTRPPFTGAARISGDDVILCVDAATGRTLWKQVFKGAGVNAIYDRHGGTNGTGCYDKGRVYMLSPMYRLRCLDGATGAVIWDQPLPRLNAAMEAQKAKALAGASAFHLHEESRLPGGYYPPLSFAGGVVFMTGNVAGAGLMGFDAESGRPAWTLPGNAAFRWAHGGREAVLVAGPSAKPRLACVEPKTARVLWESVARPYLNHYTPTLDGDFLLGVGPPPPSRRAQPLVGYRLGETGPAGIWEIADVARDVFGQDGASTRGVELAMPALYRGHVYLAGVLDRGRGGAQIAMIRQDDGRVLKRAPLPRGSEKSLCVAADGRLLWLADPMRSEPAIHLFDAETLAPLGPAGDPAGGTSAWIPPHFQTTGTDEPIAIPVVDGRLFLRGANRLYCWDLRKP